MQKVACLNYTLIENDISDDSWAYTAYLTQHLINSQLSIYKFVTNAWQFLYSLSNVYSQTINYREHTHIHTHDDVYIYKLLKKCMEYYFCLEFLYIFLHHMHMGVTCVNRLFISLHYAKTAWKSIRWEQNDSLPNAVGVKIKSCRNSFSWTLNCIDGIGVKKVWNVLSGLTNDDSCNFWFWPLPYSTMSISIIPQSISKLFSL